MGIITKPYTLAAGATVIAVEFNSNWDVLYSEFNGNIDNTNIKAGANIDAAKLLSASILTGKLADGVVSDAKLDYASVRLLRSALPGLKFARGRKAFTMVAGVISITVTFSTDTEDGINPGFTVTPIVTTAIEASGNTTYSANITARSNTSITFSVRNGAAAGSDTGFVDWFAVGA